MICLSAYRRYASLLVGRRPTRPITEAADRSWQISPAEYSEAPGAFFLPGQLERVSGSAFMDGDVGRAMRRRRVVHAATKGFLLKGAWLLDGRIYASGADLWLTPRARLAPPCRVDREITRGALFCTAMGNRYFGQWLMDDCATYPLAADEGLPITTDQAPGLHTLGYEDRLGMRPERLRNAYFRELVVFEDFGQNGHKRGRFSALRDRIAPGDGASPHPGVFILRGRSGERRLLRDELEVAERLRDRRGFRIVDPEAMDVPGIIAACAGSACVVGVEGSNLMHGVMALGAGGSILTLQPPNRFVSSYKDLADRDGIAFGFVVGRPDGDGFRIDADEAERTLDLMAAGIPAEGP